MSTLSPVKPYWRTRRSSAMVAFLEAVGVPTSVLKRALVCPFCKHTREIPEFDPEKDQYSVVCRHQGCPLKDYMFWRQR